MFCIKLDNHLFVNLYICISALINILISILGTDFQCITISGMKNPPYAAAVIGNTDVYITTIDGTNYDLRYRRVNFDTNSYVWSKYISCPAGSCFLYSAAALLSDDSSYVYTLTPYGSPRRALFVTLNATDGSVTGNRYYPSATTGACTSSDGLVQIGTKLAMFITCTTPEIGIYDITTDTFEIYVQAFSSTLYYMTADDSTNT